MIKFLEQNHQYLSLVPDNRQWLSITSIVSRLHEGFDKQARAHSCSIRKPTEKYPNKWYGMTPAQILAAWEGEGQRSIELGKWYHNRKEQELCTVLQEGITVYPAQVRDGEKVARSQKLEPGIYPEHIVYLDSEGICGQTDQVTVEDIWYSVHDHKTSKEIRTKAFSNYEGPKMMLGPIGHLEDCEFNHYSIQLSLYSYCIGKHNPNLKLKEQTINHIKFEIEDTDKNGYPVYRRDKDNGYIIKDIEQIKVPYLKKEVIAILEWLKR